jgi:hypothetical protein
VPDRAAATGPNGASTPPLTASGSVAPAGSAILETLTTGAPWQTWSTGAASQIGTSLSYQLQRGVRPGAEAFRFTFDVVALITHQLIASVGYLDVLLAAAPPKGLISGAAARGGVRALEGVVVKPRATSASALTRTEALRGAASRANVTKLAESMRTGGWQGAPIKVFEHKGVKYVIDGHHRVAAARQAGIDVVYESVGMDTLRSYGYGSADELIWSALEVGPNKL